MQELLNNSDNSDFEIYQRPPVIIKDAESGKYPCITDGPNKATFWVCAEKEEDYDDVCLSLLSQFPYPYPDEQTANSNPQIVPMHSIELEIEQIGLEALLDIQHLETFLQDEGITIGKPFQIEMSIDYYEVGGYYDYKEWDSHVDFTIKV